MLLLLCLAVGLHTYAVLLAASLGLMELIWSLVHRRIRWAHLLAIGTACLSALLWLPILRNASAFNRGDVLSEQYYAKPDLGRLIGAYWQLAGDGRIATPLLVLLVSLALLGLERVLQQRQEASAVEQTGSRRRDCNLDIITGVCCAIPLLFFLFSLIVTKAFNERYVIVGSIGLAVAAVRLVAGLPRARLIACLLIGASSLSLFQVSAKSLLWGGREDALAVLQADQSGLPIVTGNGLRFLEMSEAAEPGIARRLIFLVSPLGVVSPDPTNEHQVERWGTIRSDLAITTPESFIRAHPRFLLFHDESAVDVIPDWLARQGASSKLRSQHGSARLDEVSVAQGG
jgi:hypothetical protein